MTREELKSVIKDVMQGDSKEMIASVVKEEVEKVANTIGKSKDVSYGNSDYDNAIPKMQNGYLFMKDGSILKSGANSSPWIKVGDETKAWALGFAKMAKNKPLTSTEQKTLSESADVDGGYLVPDAVAASIVMYDVANQAVWPRATVWPMIGEKLGMPKLAQVPTAGSEDHFAGVSFSWTEEGGQKSETQPDFEFIELIAHELSGYTAITDHLIDDSAINLLNFLSNLFSKAFAWQTDKIFITGDGGGKPLGIICDPGVNIITRATASTVTFTDLVNMEKTLPSVFDNNAVWFMNKAVRAAIRNERDDNKQLILREMYNDAARGYVTTLLGFPVVMTDGKTSAIGTKGDLVLGDWSMYYIGDRQKYSMDISRHYLFRNNKTAVRMSARIDGQAAVPEAFVVLDSAVTGS